MSGDFGILVFLEGDNIFLWIGIIKGSNGIVYEGLFYKLIFKFFMDYFFKLFVVKFDMLCFYLNVD